METFEGSRSWSRRRGQRSRRVNRELPNKELDRTAHGAVRTGLLAPPVNSSVGLTDDGLLHCAGSPVPGQAVVMRDRQDPNLLRHLEVDHVVRESPQGYPTYR